MVKNDNNKTKNKILVIYLLKNVIVVTSPSFLFNNKTIRFFINFSSYFKEN